MNEEQKIVDILVSEGVIKKILNVTKHGFGDVSLKVSIQNGIIQMLHLSETKTIKLK